MARYGLMGLPLDDLSMEQTLAYVDGVIARRAVVQHTVINAAKVVLARKDPELRASIESSDIVQADGQAIVWASKLLGVPVRERIAGIDLMARLLDHASNRGYAVYFLGATEPILTEAVRRIRERNPSLRIAGMRNGYFQPEEARRVAEAIREARPDILFVAMPTPRKENFIRDYQTLMNVPFAMGVGGSLDVFAGMVRRAPVWLQRMGCEWAFRVAQEPRRLWKRYFTTNTAFVGLLLKELLARQTAPAEMEPQQ